LTIKETDADPAGFEEENESEENTQGQNLTRQVWKLEIINGTHNHEHSENPAVFGAIRKFFKDDTWKEKVAIDRRNNIQAKQTYTVQYAENPGLQIIMRDIYNERRGSVREDLGNRPPIHALLFSLTTGRRAKDWTCHYKTSNDEEGGPLTHLFIMHNMHRQLLTQNPEVIVADCTYKTNRFNMPLLNLVGMTPTNKSFFAASCFMPGEREDHFVSVILLDWRLLGWIGVEWIWMDWIRGFTGVDPTCLELVALQFPI
jgi:MULE transposase domain